MLRLALLFVAGCSPAAMPLAPAHPAHPDAPIGRVAEPPAALRPGTVRIEPPKSNGGHHHHHDHGGDK